jgi:hypothetical protein
MADPPPSQQSRISHDDALAGRRAQADGGGPVEGTQAGSRATFEGTLTGRRLEQGDPPWRWLELGDLTDKPEDFGAEFVWVDEEYVYLQDE